MSELPWAESLNIAQDTIRKLQARVAELEREVHKRDSAIHNLKAVIDDKDGWIAFENKECQRLEDEIARLLANRLLSTQQKEQHD